MTTRNKYLDKATAAFAVSTNSSRRYTYQDRNLGAMQALAAATIVLAEQQLILNKRLAHIDACLADIAGELEDD